MAKKKMKCFDEINFEHVPREKNTSIDTLSQLANDKKPNHEFVKFYINLVLMKKHAWKPPL